MTNKIDKYLFNIYSYISAFYNLINNAMDAMWERKQATN
jgi:hypothetical protein